MADSDEREEELNTLNAIYPELSIATGFSATLELAVTPLKPLLTRFIPSEQFRIRKTDCHATGNPNSTAYIERDVELSHLPPLKLSLTLPYDYPTASPPSVRLETCQNWLPAEKLSKLESEVVHLWDEYGQCQILFAYIDYLQQASERGFDLDESAEGCLILPVTLEKALLEFDSHTKQSIFNSGTYDCGICLEPKKGSLCYQLAKCGDVFCKQCLQDFYNNAISEGDVASVRCLSPDCGKGTTGDIANGRKRQQTTERTLQSRELLAMGIEESMVRRYVEMKRKKKIEADKNTVYCPRKWCQGPARSMKYPQIPADLSTYNESCPDEESDEETTVPLNQSPPGPDKQKKELNPSDRLAICEKCSLAFCKICFMGWHGEFARCFPRDPNELSAEEKASYDYIRLNTSPCPTCSSPTQKTMGCNHMRCFQCNTHFCYLCTSWLDGLNPYQHFNKPGTECYQRLWELEEGDDGQGPADGRGFRGARGWERLAVEVARAAEAEEAAAAAQADEDGRAAGRLDEAQRPPPPAENAVRDQERNRRGGNAARRPNVNDDERQQVELQRFLELAQRDEEDGWDSDELGEDDHGFLIQ